MKTNVYGVTVLSGAALLLLAGAAAADPVPVAAVATTPGFTPGQIESNGQALVYIQTADGVFAPVGATCTYCSISDPGRAYYEPAPASSTEALSGLRYTQGVLNTTTAGARFSLGVTVTNDSIGILLGELGNNTQNTGDPVTVYPTTNGVRVGSWKRRIVSADYGGLLNENWRYVYSAAQTMRAFLTTFRLSDFTNDTGELSFDGIELADQSGYDPNIVATFNLDAPLPPYVPETSYLMPVTNATFSPGFVLNPETNGQALAGITTAEGTFLSITGLTCTASGGEIGYARGEPVPADTKEALSGLRFTQIAINAGTSKWALDRTVGQKDGRVRFFLGEVGISGNSNTDNGVLIRPLFNGSRVDNWILQIPTSAWGVPVSPPWQTYYGGSYIFRGQMMSFALTDLTNGIPGRLEWVNGIEVTGSGDDLNVFGIYELPPPPPKGTIITVN
jgi:hypothetical protein